MPTTNSGPEPDSVGIPSLCVLLICGGHLRHGLPYLRCNPRVSDGQTLRKPYGRFPAQHPAQTSVIAVAAAHPLRSSQVVTLADAFARDSRDQIDQFVNSDKLVGSQV